MSSVMEELLANSTLQNLKQGSIASGIISEIRANEVIVDIGGKSEGSIPGNEFIDLGDLEIGQEIEVYIEKIEDKNGNPVLSFDRAEQQKNWSTVLEKFEEGTITSGRVKGKVQGGLIVSIGVDAFLPSSQIDIHLPKNLDQYIGQTLDFKIVKLNPLRKNIVVSRRELIEEQRQENRRKILDEVQKGAKRKGMVKNITDYGAFVDLEGLDGLLHITDMSWGRISHPSEMLKVGEEIETVILEIDKIKERVSLGLKQLQQNPWNRIIEAYPVGTQIRGKVVNLVPYGAFIEIEDGVEGLVHVSEMSWTKRINKPSEVLKIGDEVRAVVLGIQTEDQKISLGIRQLDENPWDMVKHNYPTGARVRGKVRNLTAYGAFIELEDGIDGMVHVSDMSWTRKVNHPSEIISKGTEVDAIVVSVDSQQQRISLSMKAVGNDPWENIDQLYRMGDIVKGKVNKLANYGAFIELENDIDGMVHISQITEDRVDKLKDVLKIGQEVEARVIKIDRNERRIGLSIKAANYDEDQIKKEIDSVSMNQGVDINSLGDILDNAARD